MFKTAGKLFRLKPYGNNLVDGVTELWLLFASLNILSIALCDAVAWAYFGYTTASGMAAWVAAAVAGLIVFVLVGSLDAMFVMHDRSNRQRKIVEDEAGLSAKLGRLFRRDRVAVLARVILVILTFTVTAPFLTQLFFSRDIAANIQSRNEQRLGEARATIVRNADAQIAALRSERARRSGDLEREIAGTGASGRYGDGPTAAAIRGELATLDAKIGATEAAKESEVRAFDHALATPDLLAGRYGIDLVREGPDTRAKVIAELEQSPPFRSTQRAIKAFLLFMFLGLLCLKLFQPESVRIYYSGHLQAAYRRMQAGIFNHRLHPQEHPHAAGMSPIRFADWYENDQLLHDETDRLRDQTALAIERLKAQEEAVLVLQETLRKELARIDADLSESSRTGEEIERKVLAARHELSLLNARVADAKQQLGDFRYDAVEELSLRDQQLLISRRNLTERQLSEHRAATLTLSAALERDERRLSAHRAFEEQLRESKKVVEREVETLAGGLHEARQKRVADVLSAG